MKTKEIIKIVIVVIIIIVFVLSYVDFSVFQSPTPAEISPPNTKTPTTLPAVEGPTELPPTQ